MTTEIDMFLNKDLDNIFYKMLQRMGIQDFVKENPFLYKIWFYTIRNNIGDKVKLPQKQDHLYFDGYMRSGNTYFAGLLSYIFEHLKFSSHLHVIAGIKLALKYDVPVFIIIRKPEDVVISNLFRLAKEKNIEPNQQSVDRLFSRYCDYYSFVNERKNEINIFKFSNLVEKPLDFLKKASTILSVNISRDSELELQIQKFDEKMKRKEEEKIAATSALPNNERLAFKERYMKLVLRSVNKERANNIYSTLTDKYSE